MEVETSSVMLEEKEEEKGGGEERMEEEEEELYNRQMYAIGKEAQQKLRQAKVGR